MSDPAKHLAEQAARMRRHRDYWRDRAAKLQPDHPDVPRLLANADQAEDAMRFAEEHALAASLEGALPPDLQRGLFLNDLEKRRDEKRAESERLGLGEHDKAKLQTEADRIDAAADRFRDLIRLDMPRLVKLLAAGEISEGEARAEVARFWREVEELIPPVEYTPLEGGLAESLREQRDRDQGPGGGEED